MGLFGFLKKKKKKKSIPPPEQWGGERGLNLILVNLDLPFEPDIHEVIYVENEYNPIVNEYINRHYDELKQAFRKKNVSLVYLPKLQGCRVANEELRYMFPFLSEEDTFVNGDLPLDLIKQHIFFGAIIGPALIHRIRFKTDSEHYFLSYRALIPNSEVSLADQFEWYLQNVTLDYGGKTVYYCPAEPSGDEVADYNFYDSEEEENAITTKSEQRLIQEIRERVDELRKRGVRQYLLHELFEDQPTLSKMVITSDFKIFLLDYNNIEITMAPLPKAVFLLFLKHPEGILFKHLQDYYEELLDIYKEVSNRVIENNIENSIRDITDPTKNSINEKCARIREAFLKHFDTAYAQYYYITGKRGEPKKITLPRELVVLQAL